MNNYYKLDNKISQYSIDSDRFRPDNIVCEDLGTNSIKDFMEEAVGHAYAEHVCEVVAIDGEFTVEKADGGIYLWSYKREADEELEADTTLIELTRDQAIDLAKGLLEAAGVDMSRVTLLT